MRGQVDTTGGAMVALAAVGFGIGGPLARIAGELGFNAVSFAAWRSIGSVVALAAMLAIGVAIGRLHTIPLRSIDRFEWMQLGAMGLFVAGTTLGIFLSFERISIALALIVFYTYPLMVSVAAVRLFGEPLGQRRIVAILVASLGMVLVVLGPTLGESVELDLLGVGFAFVAALCQTGYALTAAGGFRSVPSFQASTLMRGFSLLLYVLFLIPLIFLLGEGERMLGPLDGLDAWIVIIVAGVFTAALPTAGLVAGYRRVGATRGAVLMLLEPLTGVALAALLLSEQPAAVQLIGGVLVLAGAVLVQVAPGRTSDTVTQPSGE